MPAYFLYAFLTLLLSLVATSATAASFDCKLAQSKVEKMICVDNGLSTLDDQLDAIYLQIRKSVPDDQMEKATQRAWLKARDTCADMACLRRSYTARIAELRARVYKRDNAQPESPVTITSESYTLNEPFTCGETPSCRLLVCVRLDTKTDGSQHIWALVDMSDSHGVLEVSGPVTKSKKGGISFRFEDGWGNLGKGNFKTVGMKGYLSLRIISSAPDSDRTIGRNYGESTLATGTCKTDRS